MPHSQSQINAVVQRLLNGDDEALGDLRAAFEAGEITVHAGTHHVSIRATPAALGLSAELSRLRALAGDPTQTELADRLGVSSATVSRILAGHRAGSWPMIYRLVEILGGDPAEFQPLWRRARHRHGE